MSRRLILRSTVLLAALFSLCDGLHASQVQLDFTANFTSCSGNPCSSALPTQYWNGVTGNIIFDPATSTGTIAPPPGSAPDFFSTNVVYQFSGLAGMRSSLDAGPLHAESTGINPPANPVPGYGGFGTTSGAIGVYNGQTYRSGDWVVMREQSITNVSGALLPPGGHLASNPFDGPSGQLMISFSYSLLDDPLKTIAIPLDLDSVGTPNGTSVVFEFWWASSTGFTELLRYTGNLTGFSTQAYVAPTGGNTLGGGGTGNSVPEPGSLALALAAGVAAALRKGGKRPFSLKA